MKVDAHQHFWTTARSDYGWLTPDLAPLWRDFLPSDLAPLAPLAQASNFSGMVTEAPPGYADDAFSPYFAFLLSRSGAQRLMWGSDWPVLNLNGDYASWHACVERLSSSLGEEDRAAIFGETARSFYRL